MVTASCEAPSREPPVIPSLLVRLAFSIAPALPDSLLASLSRATARVEYSLSARRRRAVVSNLVVIARAGHRSLTRARELERTARSIFESYHRFVVEYFSQGSLDADVLDTRFRFRGMERAYGALARGRGAVVCAPHVGNWELAGIALSRLGFRVHVVTGIQFHRRWTEHGKHWAAVPAGGRNGLLATR